MDKRIVDTYVRKIIGVLYAPEKDQTENIDHLVNALHIALSGSTQQSKSLILEVLLEEPK